MKYVPHRLVLLEKFGASYYTMLFRLAQAADAKKSRKRVVKGAVAYLRAGGTDRGLRETMAHVQTQAMPLLKDWYDVGDASPLLSGELAQAVVDAAEDQR